MARLTLHRPDRLNAMTAEMFGELTEVAERLRLDDGVRAVVLTGAGGGFCAGYDLDAAAGFPEAGTAELLALQDTAWRALHAVYALPKPVVAAVHGPAAGGGFSLSLTADIRLAGTSARFQAVFVRIGLSGGDLGASWLLPRLVGTGLAAELLYTGRPVLAEEAVRIGLVNRVVEDAALATEAVELAAQIAEHAPLAVQLTKRSLRANVDAPALLGALELESRAQVALLREPATTEAVARLRHTRRQRPTAD
ncbi:MAG TPA: enoyl-CoA hydratase-related protein [Pseudonocardia sp.]|nr:enoyl-CoA hydratase-related protein [Pseudonocardia sp.]